MPASACCAISVYVAWGYRLRHFSTPRESTTPPLSAVRNFDGTVSRFLASRLCSKVPVKAKAHVFGEARGGQSIRGGGVGGAPPPRTGFAMAKYPTSSHRATQNPTLLSRRHSADAQSGRFRGFRAGGIGPRGCTCACTGACCTAACATVGAGGASGEEFARRRRVPLGPVEEFRH